MESEAEFKMMWLKFSSPTVIRLFIFTFIISFNHVSILFIFFINCFCFIFFLFTTSLSFDFYFILHILFSLPFFFGPSSSSLMIDFIFLFLSQEFTWKNLEIYYENEKDPEEAIKDNKKGPTKFMRKNENTSQKIWQHTNDYIWIDSKILNKNIW